MGLKGHLGWKTGSPSMEPDFAGGLADGRRAALPLNQVLQEDWRLTLEPDLAGRRVVKQFKR